MYVQPTAPSDCAHHMRKHQDTHLIDMQIVPCSKLCDSVSPANCTNQLLLSDTGQKPGASHHRHGEYSAFNAVQFRSRNCFMVNVAQIRRRKNGSQSQVVPSHSRGERGTHSSMPIEQLVLVNTWEKSKRLPRIRSSLASCKSNLRGAIHESLLPPQLSLPGVRQKISLTWDVCPANCMLAASSDCCNYIPENIKTFT